MNHVDLNELERLHAAATAGEWIVREYPDCFPLIKMSNDEIQDISRREDADFIAAAHNALPELIARCRRAEGIASLATHYVSARDAYTAAALGDGDPANLGAIGRSIDGLLVGLRAALAAARPPTGE